MKLNDTLKKRRIELGLTLIEVARAVGVTEATVQRWESGKIKTIGSDKIKKLASVLCVSIHSLVDMDEVEKRADALDSLLVILKDIYDEVLIREYEETGSYNVTLIKDGEQIQLDEVPYETLFKAVCSAIPNYVKTIKRGYPIISGINEKDEYVEDFPMNEKLEIVRDLLNLPNEALGDMKIMFEILNHKFNKKEQE